MINPTLKFVDLIKQLIFIGLVLFNFSRLSAQYFAPVGAKWHYTETFAFTGDISYLMIESVKDTVFKGNNCRILESNHGLICTFNHLRNYVYDEDSIVYFYVPETDTFQILYNLKAQKDSSWVVVFTTEETTKPDTICVLVDSVEIATINGHYLKKLYVTYQSMNAGWEQFRYNGEIVDRIGDIGYLFNLNSLSGIMCDGNFSTGLRCYQDSVLGFYSTGIADSCTYTFNWTGISENNSFPDMEISPNPGYGLYNIKIKNESDYTVTVYDLYGKLLLARRMRPDAKLDLTNLPSGVYCIKACRDKKVLGIRKIIKY